MSTPATNHESMAGDFQALRPFMLMHAARVPATLEPQAFGDRWTIERRELPADCQGPWQFYTLLRKLTLASLHIEPGEIVMEDSPFELRRHLPILLSGEGRILITGLGLGCVVRGLLSKPEVDHIDVIEIDEDIIRVVGAEFDRCSRVTLHHGDALKIEIPGEWEFAWHDIHSEDESLQVLHGKLFIRFNRRARRQGAWDFPRDISRLMPWQPLGSPKHRRVRR